LIALGTCVGPSFQSATLVSGPSPADSATTTHLESNPTNMSNSRITQAVRNERKSVCCYLDEKELISFLGKIGLGRTERHFVEQQQNDQGQQHNAHSCVQYILRLQSSPESVMAAIGFKSVVASRRVVRELDNWVENVLPDEDAFESALENCHTIRHRDVSLSGMLHHLGFRQDIVNKVSACPGGLQRLCALRDTEIRELFELDSPLDRACLRMTLNVCNTAIDFDFEPDQDSTKCEGNVSDIEIHQTGTTQVEPVFEAVPRVSSPQQSETDRHEIKLELEDDVCDDDLTRQVEPVIEAASRVSSPQESTTDRHEIELELDDDVCENDLTSHVATGLLSPARVSLVGGECRRQDLISDLKPGAEYKSPSSVQHAFQNQNETSTSSSSSSLNNISRSRSRVDLKAQCDPRVESDETHIKLTRATSQRVIDIENQDSTNESAVTNHLSPKSADLVQATQPDEPQSQSQSSPTQVSIENLTPRIKGSSSSSSKSRRSRRHRQGDRLVNDAGEKLRVCMREAVSAHKRSHSIDNLQTTEDALRHQVWRRSLFKIIHWQ
jgi:hypothetical protein